MILKCAREAFLINGYNRTDIGNIARDAGINKRTIYRYFVNKEALAFVIWKQVLEEILDISIDHEGKSGYHKLESLLYEYISRVKKNQEVIRFLGEFDHVFSGEYPNIDEAEQFVSFIRNSDNVMLSYIKEGMKDKSIIEDIDPLLVSSTLSNLLMSLSQRVVIRGEHLKIEQGYSFELLDEGVRLLLLGIKGSTV